MSNNIFWSTYTDTNVDTFNIYRAVTGFSIDFPNSLALGDKLVFAATSPSIQTVTISATDITSVMDAINTQAQGIKATQSLSGTTLYIRCTAHTDPKIRLYPCTFLTHTGQLPRLIAPRSEFFLIANVSFVSGQSDYTYVDMDGVNTDWYHVTTVLTGTESIPSQDLQSIPNFDNLCMIEGRVVNLENKPIIGAEITATIMIPVGFDCVDNSGISKRSLHTITDELGRWSLAVMQCQEVLLHIPSIGYNQVVVIPAQSYVLFKDLAPEIDYYYSPSGEH